jgi:hypothetical protein
MRILFVGAIILSLGNQRVAPLPPVSLPAQAREELSVVAGRIRGAEDALPIHRARIVLTWSGGAIGPVFTDEAGAFTIQAPPISGYVLHVSRSGFAARTSSRRSPPGGTA